MKTHVFNNVLYTMNILVVIIIQMVKYFTIALVHVFVLLDKHIIGVVQ